MLFSFQPAMMMFTVQGVFKEGKWYLYAPVKYYLNPVFYLAILINNNIILELYQTVSGRMCFINSHD